VCSQRLKRGTLLEDVARWETNRAYSEWLQVQRQRRQVWIAAQTVERAQGEDTPSEPESSGEENEEEDRDGEESQVTPPPNSPPHEALPLLGDILSMQARVIVGVHPPKWPRTKARP
jgi:hypothetical protein